MRVARRRLSDCAAVHGGGAALVVVPSNFTSLSIAKNVEGWLGYLEIE